MMQSPSPDTDGLPSPPGTIQDRAGAKRQRDVYEHDPDDDEQGPQPRTRQARNRHQDTDKTTGQQKHGYQQEPKTSSTTAEDMIAEYKASGFGNVMGWGSRPVLLMVDVCKAYWTEGSPLSTLSHAPSANAPEVMRRLVAAARRRGGAGAGCPIIWTAVEYSDPGMRDAGLFWAKSKSLEVFREGDGRGLGGWLDGLEPEKGEMVIKKKYASAFFGTSLATHLAVLGADTVVLCGVSTSGCVRASTLDAMQCGYRPMVVASACGDRSDEIQNANLFDLNAKYADVVTEAEAVEHLQAGWPKA